MKQKNKHAKLLQYAERVWGITTGDETQRVLQAIALTTEFFESVGVPTHLSDYGVEKEAAKRIANKLTQQGAIALGEHQDIAPADVEQILALSA